VLKNVKTGMGNKSSAHTIGMDQSILNSTHTNVEMKYYGNEKLKKEQGYF
jgi:hypothetical protein